MPSLFDYKIVLYRQPDNSWAAYVPALEGCQAVMPTRDQALGKLQNVFEMICEEHEEPNWAQ
jgi:predicted RNase H-like HicB family nuclease